MVKPYSDKEILTKSCLDLLEHYPQPTWIRSIKGRYIWVNDSFLKFFNVNAAQVIGKRNADFMPPHITLKCFLSEQEIVEKRCGLTFDYEEKDYKATVHKTPVFSDQGEMIAISGMMMNFTSQIDTPLLNNTQDFYQSLLANMGEALFFINTNSEFEVVNHRAQEILSEIDFEGPLTYEVWNKLFPHRYSQEGNAFKKNKGIIFRALNGEKILNEVVHLETKKGIKKVFRASAIPFKNKDSHETLGVILTVTDITKENYLLDKLAQKNKLVEQRNEELHQFAYSAAHDLRDPLRNISLSASLIYEKLKEQNYEEIEALLQRLLHTASYGSSLVKNLLDYSAANREIQMGIVKLNEIAKHTTTILKGIIERAKAKVIIDNLPAVKGNSQQLQVVFQNIISNAIRYKGEDPVLIHISATRKKSFWVISIQDNGPGIDKKYKEDIFLPFKRVSAQTSSRSSGLGLSICRRIIEQHGGEIWLETHHSPGACFMFTLKAIPDVDSSLPSSL